MDTKEPGRRIGKTMTDHQFRLAELRYGKSAQLSEADRERLILDQAQARLREYGRRVLDVAAQSQVASRIGVREMQMAHTKGISTAIALVLQPHDLSIVARPV